MKTIMEKQMQNGTETGWIQGCVGIACIVKGFGQPQPE